MKRFFALALVLIAVGAAILPQQAQACTIHRVRESRDVACNSCSDLQLPDRVTEKYKLWYGDDCSQSGTWYETEHFCTLDWSCDHAR